MSKKRQSERVERYGASQSKITLEVPQDVHLPPVIKEPEPERFPPKRAVRLELPSTPQKWKRVRVSIIPAKSKARMAKVMFRPGQFTIYGERNVRLTNADEFNKRRNDRKPQRRERHLSSLASVRADRHGVIGRAVNRGRGYRHVAAAAVVSRWLSGR